MDSEKFEKRTNINFLLAENKKLKHLLNRISGYDDKSKTDRSFVGYPPYHLPLSVSRILSSELPFEEQINSILKYLGEFTVASRVYIFEDNIDGTSCSNTYEWCNEEVESQKEFLKDFKYSDMPSWKPLMVKNGYIISSDIEKDFPADIVKILKIQKIKSILALPLSIGDKFIGFIGLDECSFYRKWTDFEKVILRTVARLISYAFEQNNSVIQIQKSLQVQRFLFDIASLLNQSNSLDASLQPVVRKILSSWDLDAVAFYFRDKSDSGYYALEASSFKENSGVIFPVKVSFNDTISLASLPNSNVYELCSSNEQIALRRRLGFTSENCLVATIKAFNGPNGLFAIRWKNEAQEPPMDYKVLETITGMLARFFDLRQADEKNQHHHQQILEINKQLEEKESFLNNIIMAAPIGIILIKDKSIQYVNDQVVESTGYSRKELIGLNISELYADDPESHIEILEFYDNIRLKGKSLIDIHLKKKSGELLYYHIIGTPGPGDVDEGEGWYLLIGQDLTQIKAVEDSLIASEDRNRYIIEANIDGIFILNKSGDLEYVNQAGCDLTGYSWSELVNLELSALFPEKGETRHYLKVINQIRKGYDYRGESVLKHKSGKQLFVEIHGTRISRDGDNSFYFSMHDITHRKEKESELRLSEEKFRSLSENLPDCIIRVDKNGEIIYWNSVFYDLHFADNETIKIGQNIKIEDLPGGFAEYFLPAFNFVLNNKKMVQLEMQIRSRDENLTLDWSLTPELDDAGEFLSLLGIGRNITPRKEVEKELMLAKEKAETADRLKSAFLANMSHEIRTPLNAIVGFTNLLGQTDPECAEREEYISLINSSADNLMSLITDIVDIAKMESGLFNIHCKKVSVEETMLSVYHIYLKRVEHQFKGRVELRYSPPAPVEYSLWVDADPARLIQILNNVLDNAIKFINSGIIDFGYTVEQQRVRFFVRDTGIGIAPENQKYVFDAFRQIEDSSSRRYGGTGLGLAICKKLVEAMNGEVGLISEINKGTEIFFYLNLHPDTFSSINKDLSFSEENDALAIEIPDWSSKLLLIVDENSSMHMQIKKYLEKTGATILLARSGAAARTILNTRQDISAVIMDNTLPDMDAKDLIQQLRVQNIMTPILIQGKGIHHESLEEFYRVGIDGYLSDPLEELELISRIKHF